MSRATENYITNHAELTHNILSQSTSFQNLLSPRARKIAFDGWKSSEAAWGDYNDFSKELEWFLKGHPQLRFRRLAEVDRSLESYLVTDRHGIPLSASQKPTQFAQNKTDWWNAIKQVPASTILVRDLTEPKGQHSFEVLGSITAESNPEEIQGYLRIVVNTQPLLEEFARSASWQGYQGILATANGRILLHKGVLFESLSQTNIPKNLLDELRSDKSVIHTRHSGLVEDNEIVLAAHLTRESSSTPSFISLSAEPGFKAITPLLETHKLQLSITLGIIACSIVAGFYYMKRTISQPIESIRSITNVVQCASEENAKIKRSSAQKIVAPLSDIHTGDEIEGLAKEFSSMAQKVLGFQQRLEEEVASKTHTIQEDLEMAKEFQQALLPINYPEVEVSELTSFALEFAHAYRPAASVSGDFFDIIKIDPARYAVFIGDVMGHGARSALVTAILRALVESTCISNPEPKQFMEELNHRFCEIIERSNQTVFVTAAYLLFDTQKETVSICSAGHPCPIVINSADSVAHQMIENLDGALPLGLYQGTEYVSKTIPMGLGNLILLYTDGITEAEDQNGTQYGEENLAQLLSRFHPLDTPQIVQAIEATIMQYSNEQLDDDFCLLLIRGVEAKAMVTLQESTAES